MKKLFFNLAFGVVLVILLTVAYSCSDSTNNPVNNNPVYDQLSINGRVTFPDTNGYYKYQDTSKGYYNISAFSQWPPVGNASANSKLTMKIDGGKLVADYKIILPANGLYTITSAYIRLPYTAGSVFGMGKYGSDTSHSPAAIFDTTNARVIITGNNGVGNINFLSWLDTTKRIYKF